MKKRLLVITLLLGFMLCIACPAAAKIVPTPASVTFGSREIGFVSVACDGKTVTLVLSGFDGKIRIKNNKQVLTYQAYIVVDGKTVKWKTGAAEGENYTYTYKAKKLPDSIKVFRIEDAWTGPYLSADIALTDDEYIPVETSVVLGGYTLTVTTPQKAFKGKGTLTNVTANVNIGNDIMLKGSTLPKSFFQYSKQAETMLIVPVTLKAAMGQAQDTNLTQTLLAAKMSDGTALYDLWYSEQLACFVFDTDAYAGKTLGVAVVDGTLTFGYMK